MFKKIYIEITNKCNLSCGFCHKTQREPYSMKVEEFSFIADRVKNKGKEFYLHVMGEPLFHSDLAQILAVADEKGMSICITTNGTLLKNKGEILLKSKAVRKVSVSLHAFESAVGKNISEYLNMCIAFALRCKENKKVCVLRLWNINGENSLNNQILARLKEVFPSEWQDNYNGKKLCEYVFLEWGEKFEWPDIQAIDYGEKGFCHGLRSQIAILCNGDTVPCCLDSDGILKLGNIFENTLEEIINTPRALKIKEGFSKRRAEEQLCRRCGYAQRFQK